jgi:hypothetical protein
VSFFMIHPEEETAYLRHWLKGHMTRKLTVLFFSLIWKIIENCRVTSLIDFCFLASFWRYFILYDMQRRTNFLRHICIMIYSPKSCISLIRPNTISRKPTWVLLRTNLVLIIHLERIYLIVTKLYNILK